MTERRGSFDREEAHSKLYERMHADRPFDDRLRAALDVDLGFITEIDIETNLDAPAELQQLDVVSTVDRAVSQLADRYPTASIAVSAPECATAETAP
ncbi:MAG: hypothetical protein RI560_08630 [Natronomonas sp.]|jgi:SPX domain protein involved in polyphosphate accumulation|uniref:Uncharacterized protein n=1 Tax=Natronomonas salsuginis TaxID=2217661 RepID=A0A4V5ZNQ0_9EURY|nr:MULTISPECIES: hypothetical protein [Natronomonas]MDR9381718.1 hypothetical protein [Natronomonas sp.]MDR9432180.1 hypothetical protein [Natronomonas sp.]TKR25993.1 hypothetical protein DM868_05735 [Natronomonas salsuginis]